MADAKYDIEIYERPIGFLDDHFRSGWTLIRSAASQSFVNNGGLVADLGIMNVTESGTSDGAGWEKGGLSVNTDTYKKFIARLRGLGYDPMYYILVMFTDTSNVNTGWVSAPSDMTLVSLDLPTGKTVEKIQLFIRAGSGANGQSAEIRWDYAIIVKSSPITPTEVKEIDVELSVTTAISGFKFVLINDNGLYTEKPAVGDLVMIHLAAGEENMDQKLISGYITDKEPSGDPGNPIVTITGADLGQLFHDRTFTKEYTSAELISEIARDIQEQQLTGITGFSIEASDNSITPEFNEEDVFNLLRKLADASRKGTVYGYDFYIDPAGDFHFVPNPKYTCSEKIYAGMFYDEFKGNLDKWAEDTNRYPGGTWAIESEELSQSKDDANYSFFAGNKEWVNYVIESKVKIISVNPGTGNGRVGLHFRFKDYNNYYYLLIGYNDINTKFRLMKIVNGTWYDIENYDVGNPQLGIWYRMKVEINGTSIKCYLNDILYINVTDSDIDKGKIGCITEKSHSHFDDVIVKAYNEPPYNIKRLSWKETIEDIGNDIKLLIREGEYEPHNKDSWTENVSRWESPQSQVVFSEDAADKKLGDNSIKAEFSSDPGLIVQLRRKMTVDITFFEKIRFWDRWSVSGPVDYWRVRLYTNLDDSTTDYYQRELFVGSAAPASKPWSTEEDQNISSFTKVGDPSNEVVCIEIALRNTSTNIGTGYIKIDGLHFALPPITKTASDSASQDKYGIKKKNFEDLTITDQDFAQFMANALVQALKNPIKHVHVVVPGKAQEGYRPPAQVIVSSAKDNIHYEYFKILKARHHYVTSREEAPLYICDLDLIAAKKTDGTYEVPIAKEPPSIRALKPISVLSPSLKAISRKGYYWY